MIISAATNIKKDLLEQRLKIYKEHPEGAEAEIPKEKSLGLIGEEMDRIKAFGASVVAMSMAFHDGFKLNPRQLETLGQMIVDLADKVTENLTKIDPPPPTHP
jgi:hypothetical protein